MAIAIKPDNLGNEFDIGTEEANKIHVKLDDTLTRDPGTGEIGVAGGGSIVGMIAAFLAAPPAGWLAMEGQTVAGGVALYPTLAALYPGFVVGADLVLPDFRGQFLRGQGGNSGALGAQQGQATAVNGLTVTHQRSKSGNTSTRTYAAVQTSKSPANNGLTNATATVTGDAETRPVNIAVIWAVKTD